MWGEWICEGQESALDLENGRLPPGSKELVGRAALGIPLHYDLELLTAVWHSFALLGCFPNGGVTCGGGSP